MCGITGVIESSHSRLLTAEVMSSLLNPIHHRGPDDFGMWIERQCRVALGHRRLSIVDLSPAGHQPMHSSCGRFVIVFNGEIYNHRELRERLETANHVPAGGWRGHSDTETLLACFEAWGIEKTLQATVGMFALAVWCHADRALILARDRMGEKPLYYGWQNGAFLFGSELKSLKAHPAFDGEIDWDAAGSFLRHNYIPAPSTIYIGILKLMPGTYLKLTQEHVRQNAIPEPVNYWRLSDVAIDGLQHPFKGSFTDAVDELEGLIRQAVQLQSVADVPVGAFLSGGIDSSTVVAMMQRATSAEVMTFSIGMPDAGMDESVHAAAVARHLGTRHIQHVIQPREALSLIPQLSDIWDEPFADSSQIPTFLVSQLAKQNVTVALSGDGGDEFFLGYPQYELYRKLWKMRYLGKLPWDMAFSALAPIAKLTHINQLLHRGKSLVDVWRKPDIASLNQYWMDRYRGGELPLNRQYSLKSASYPYLPDPATAAGLWDANVYLPDDVLAKVDRAAMANSLETRAPLLDHRIIEFAYRLPPEFKLAASSSKRVLREVLYRHVPKEIVDRPKMGFSIPLGSWLKQELRPWAEELITQIPTGDGMLNKAAIFALWQEHLSGRRVHTEKLWGILMLASFLSKAK